MMIHLTGDGDLVVFFNEIYNGLAANNVEYVETLMENYYEFRLPHNIYCFYDKLTRRGIGKNKITFRQSDGDYSNIIFYFIEIMNLIKLPKKLTF